MLSETKPIRTMREISFIDLSPDFQQNCSEHPGSDNSNLTPLPRSGADGTGLTSVPPAPSEDRNVLQETCVGRMVRRLRIATGLGPSQSHHYRRARHMPGSGNPEARGQAQGCHAV